MGAESWLCADFCKLLTRRTQYDIDLSDTPCGRA